MKIQAIREAKAAKVNECRALLTKADTEKRQLSADESTAFDRLKNEITLLESDEHRAQFMDDQERRMPGTPVQGQETDSFAGLEKQVKLLDVVQSRLEGRSLTGAAAEYHAEVERRTGRKAQGVLVPLSLLEKRTNLTTTAGDLVPTIHRGDQYIGPLRDSLVVRSLGVRVLSDLTGNIEIPKFGSGLTAGWVNENEAISTSDMTFENVSLKPRHVAAITSWSRKLAMQSNPSIEQLLRDELAYAIGKAVDGAIITGDGVKQPLGIVNTTGVQTATIPADWDDVVDVEGKLADININPNAWYLRGSVLRPLRKTLKNASAGADYIATRTSIGELPAYTSTAAPADTAILGDWSQLILGTWGVLDLLLNPYETDAFNRGNVLIRAIMSCDLVARYPEAFVVCKPASGS